MASNPFLMPAVHRGVQSAHRRPFIIRREVGIPQGHLQVFVPQEFLHRHQVNARHDEVTGERMAEIMEHEALNAGFL